MNSQAKIKPIESIVFRDSFISLLIILISMRCSPQEETLFVLRTPEQTGIDFSNTIFESDTFNIFTYDYIYNGGGVAVADFNNDGFQDIFFTGNMVPNRLYLNQGNFRFKDVTEMSNVNLPNKWNSGVTVVDINNDGWNDIYVCSTKSEDSLDRANMLFLNKGVDNNNTPVFEEVASQYGIADSGYSLMAAFFDYNNDGHQDLYVLTNKQSDVVSSNYRPKVVDGSSPTTDRLYRNNGDGSFTNVSKEAGILFEGFGLGLAVADFNSDGWADIYVCNDFITNDVLYVNNRDGSFTNQSPTLIAHQSHSSMGNDAADFNNDGLIDVVTMDMLPETNDRKKTSISNKSYLSYINNESFGYEYQYMRNMLHLNNGAGAGFSEIGQLAGIYQTEWSWSSLFADFDNDGYKDLVVTNGFPKDITDKDFVSYRNDVGAYLSNKQLVDSVPVVKITNYAFKNNGDLTFTDVSKEWGFNQPSFSNGAAFADLDNDGDLDYIVNNINDPAFVFENTLYSSGKQSQKHYLRIRLVGPASNIHGLGAKVSVFYGSGLFQYFDFQMARGYLSSVEGTIHVGLDDAERVDSIHIQWPDGKFQRLKGTKADQVVEIKYNPDDGLQETALDQMHRQDFVLEDVTQNASIDFEHMEDDRIDYNIQRTLPHKFSQSGPGISVADINNDQLDDIIFGGSSGYLPAIYVQRRDGLFAKFEESGIDDEYRSQDKIEEDQGLLFFDADNDGDADLYIVSGSIESEPGSSGYQDRLYINNGAGKFHLDADALPVITSSGSCVRAADWDGDGDLDLFVGGRVIPGSYPYPAESYLLQNNGGKFTNVTLNIGPDLAEVGMVTDALFTDFNNDRSIDLIVVGEFMPVTFFENRAGKFIQIAKTGIHDKLGWWNSIASGDFDNDGDWDYVVGNMGMNNSYHASSKYPLKVFAKDFDMNGSVDAVLACYIKESLKNKDVRRLYPVHFWDELSSQSPRFRQQFSRYEHYGRATIDKIFSQEELEDALILDANYLSTSYIENLGNGLFEIKPLPIPAQVSPVNGIVTDDINLDGNLDILMIGNDFGNEIFVGRMDALTGLVLLGDGKGNFEVIKSSESGFFVNGDAKALVKLYGADARELIVASKNRGHAKVFQITKQQKGTLVPLKPFDVWADFYFADGSKSHAEFYYGSGYLSQSSRKLKIPNEVKEVIIYQFDGSSRTIHPKLP